MPFSERRDLLVTAICRTHTDHYERNVAYRTAVAARGVGPCCGPTDFARLLRPAALTFKGYADLIGPFPQDDPLTFLRWLSDQLSMPLASERWSVLRRRYSSLEALLRDIERIYADMGLQIVTSTGTSGRASIVARDHATIALAIDAFFGEIGQAWGIARGAGLVFMMPAETRVAMARTAVLGTRHLNWATDGAVYFTVPFAATPDQLRVRAGRTYRPGLQGLWERRALHPFMAWANARLAEPRFVALTLAALRAAAARDRPVMLLGGLVQLHAVAQAVLAAGASVPSLPPGSRIATGGGMKELYPLPAAAIRADLRKVFGDMPIADVYGMAEANWAAFECMHGNHHLPAWVYTVVTDDQDCIVTGADATGLLAFFDPLGGGQLVPPFFQTADRVRLINGGGGYDPALRCPCGRDTPYVTGGIRRVDLMDEAGCAAQV
jgi:hypothetical protein